MFLRLVNEVLNETGGMTAGGEGSVLGSGVTSTSTHISADTYQPDDARVPKVIGSKLIKRNMPKDTVFKGAKTRKRRKKRKK